MRARDLVLTEADKTRLKQAEREWTNARKKFERSFGAAQATELRETLNGW
jgi:hypothetical protein